MLESRNTIQDVLTNKYLFVRNQDESIHSLVLKIKLNKNSFILRKTKHISVIFASSINSISFNNSFNHKYLTKTRDSLKFLSSDEFENNFKNDVRKNILIDYNSSSNIEKLLEEVATVEYSINNFLSETSNLYSIMLDSDFSKKIHDDAINFELLNQQEGLESDLKNKIRFVLLDENKNILEVTNFYNISFAREEISNSYQSLSTNEVDHFESVLINRVLDSIKLEYYTGFILSPLSSDLESLDFLKSNIRESTSNQNRIGIGYKPQISEYTRTFRSVTQTFGSNIDLTSPAYHGLVDVIKLIAGDFLINDIPEAVVDISLKVREGYNNIYYHRQLTFNRQSSFVKKSIDTYADRITNLFMRRTNRLINIDEDSYSSNISNSSDENQTIYVPIKVSYSGNYEVNKIISKIKINRIVLNDRELDFIYNSRNISIENRVDYKGESILDLVSQNALNMYFLSTGLNQNLKIFGEFVSEYFTSPEKKLLDINLDQDNSNLEYNVFQNVVNRTNILFKNNFRYSDIYFNTFIIEKSIFNFHNLALYNLEDFNSIALNYGYIDNENPSKGNVIEFLENIVIEVENTSIFEEDEIFQNSKDILFLGREFFDFTNIDLQNNSLKVKNSSLVNIKINDLSFLSEGNEGNLFFSKLLSFFRNNSNEVSYINIVTKLNSFSIKNKLKLKVLPIPKIISDNLGIGITTSDMNTQYNISQGELTSSEYELLNTTFYNYFLANGEYQTDPNVIERYKEILFVEDEERLSIDRYRSIFTNKINIVNNSFFYKQEYSINRNQILESLNIDNEYPKIFLEPFDFNFREFFNIEINQTNVSYDNLPYNIRYDNYTQDLQNSNVFLPETITFVMSESNVKLDISNIYDYIKDDYNFNISLRNTIYFLFDANNITQGNLVNNDNFEIINYKGRKYLSYNINFYSRKNIYNRFKYFHNLVIPKLYKRSQSGRSFFSIDTNKKTIELSNEIYKNNMIKSGSGFNNKNNISQNIYSNYIDLFEFAKLNQIKFLDKIVARTSVEFLLIKPPGQSLNLNTCTYFCQEISPINLVNQKISIDNLSNIYIEYN